MSVLFCDLVGFTAASERADPEDVRARVRPYHERLRGEVEAYGGTVEKFIGDAVMAAFGAPVAHEDDAERAVRAGLRILEAIEELNEADPEADLQVRVGINTGEAVVALGARPEQGEGLVTGDVVNTAARIQGAAPVGGVAVGEQTYRATSRVFEYEQLEPVVVKGKAEPLALWRATAARARFGTDISRQYTTPLVGRELEKPLLIGTFERAAQQRSVQLVTIVGEPGVGKSRLVAELFAYLWTKPELTTVAAGALPALRGGDHVLGAGRDRQGGGGHPRVRLGPGGDGQVGRGCFPGRAGAAVAVAAAGAAGRGRGGLVGGAAGAVHRLAALPGRVGGGAAERARVRGPALGGRGAARLPRASGRVGRGRAAAPPLHGATGAPREASRLGGRDAKRDDDQSAAALGSGDGPARLSPDHRDRSRRRSWSGACSSGRAAIRSMRRSSCVCSPIAASSGTERCRSAAGELAGADRRPSGHALAGAEESAPGRGRAREGVLGRRPGRDRRPRPGRARAGAARARPQGARAPGPRELDGGRERVLVLARARPRRRLRPDPAGGSGRVVTARRPPGSSARRASRVEDLAEVLAHHYLQALELAEAAGDTKQADELAAPARRFLALAGERALGLDTAQAEARLARALELTPADDPGRAELLDRWADAAYQAGHPHEAAAALEEALVVLHTRRRHGSRRPRTDPARERHARSWARAAASRSPPRPSIYSTGAARPNARRRLHASRHGAVPRGRATARRSPPPSGRWRSPRRSACPSRREWSPSAAARAPSLAIGTALPRWSVRFPCSSSRARADDAAILQNNLSIARYPLQGPARSLADLEQGIAFCEQRGLAEVAATGSRPTAPACSSNSAGPSRRSSGPARSPSPSRRAAPHRR